MKKTTYIDGYKVELETEIDDDPSTQCDVEKGNKFGSLASGCLVDHNTGEEEYIPAETYEMIEVWAEENGY
jgi:hypothetical protein